MSDAPLGSGVVYQPDADDMRPGGGEPDRLGSAPNWYP
jgi:hypothetical protein